MSMNVSLKKYLGGHFNCCKKFIYSSFIVLCFNVYKCTFYFDVITLFAFAMVSNGGSSVSVVATQGYY